MRAHRIAVAKAGVKRYSLIGQCQRTIRVWLIIVEDTTRHSAARGTHPGGSQGGGLDSKIIKLRFLATKIRITQRKLNQNRKYFIILTHWSVAQAGSNYEKN